MRYMCLVHFEPSKLDALPQAARQDVDRRSLAYDAKLKAERHYVASEAIEGGDSAVLVRVRQGQMSTTDGPFIETVPQQPKCICTFGGERYRYTRVDVWDPGLRHVIFIGLNPSSADEFKLDPTLNRIRKWAGRPL